MKTNLMIFPNLEFYSPTKLLVFILFPPQIPPPQFFKVEDSAFTNIENVLKTLLIIPMEKANGNILK
ncbi:hypothetical protein [Epilithonimonas sp.]|uniref:hypothetical protein n=1 Tax=Epilithonimonas sp. TaxID=2894511 RepID=UPI0035B39DAF